MEAGRGSAQEFENLAKINAAKFSNYVSFEDQVDLALGEIERITQAGHLSPFLRVRWN